MQYYLVQNCFPVVILMALNMYVYMCLCVCVVYLCACFPVDFFIHAYTHVLSLFIYLVLHKQ